MGQISAQVSVYPLRRQSIGPVIRRAVRCLRQHELDVRVGEMSTTVWGDEQALFDALREAFRLLAEDGDVVMHVTRSDTCPDPSSTSE